MDRATDGRTHDGFWRPRSWTDRSKQWEGKSERASERASDDEDEKSRKSEEGRLPSSTRAAAKPRQVEKEGRARAPLASKRNDRFNIGHTRERATASEETETARGRRPRNVTPALFTCTKPVCSCLFSVVGTSNQICNRPMTHPCHCRTSVVCVSAQTSEFPTFLSPCLLLFPPGLAGCLADSLRLAYVALVGNCIKIMPLSLSVSLPGESAGDETNAKPGDVGLRHSSLRHRRKRS